MTMVSFVGFVTIYVDLTDDLPRKQDAHAISVVWSSIGHTFDCLPEWRSIGIKNPGSE